MLCCANKRRGIGTFMEYINVTFTAYLGATIVSALLAATYFYQFYRHKFGLPFALAAVVHSCYLGATTLSLTSESLEPNWLLFLECLHYNAWVLAIALTLHNHTKRQPLPRSLQILFGGGLPLTSLALL